MEEIGDKTIPVLRFICGKTENICRLCYSVSDTNLVGIDDIRFVQTPFYEDTVSYRHMLSCVDMAVESELNINICESCAEKTITSYLFKQQYEYSNNLLHEMLERFEKSAVQQESATPAVKTIYVLFPKEKGESCVLTSRITNRDMSNRDIVGKIKSLVRSKTKYKRVERKVPQTVICEECGEEFRSNYHLSRHRLRHSKQSYPCKDCPKIFSSLLLQQEHAERVHYPKQIQCPKCDKKFSTLRMLKCHDGTQHQIATCPRCLIQLPSRKALKYHLDKHDPIECPTCGKLFRHKHSFGIHVKMCGKKNKVKFTCDICSKSYAGKNGIRAHLITEHGFGKAVKCKWCNKLFSAASKMKNHILKHTKEKNFHCDNCGGKFVTLAALKCHVRIHTGETPYPCDMCDASFVNASRRMEHKRRKHFGPQRVCHLCHSSFVTGHELKKHLARHTNPHSRLYITDIETKHSTDVTFEVEIVPLEQEEI